MDPLFFSALVGTLIVSWMVGVISFVWWITYKIAPGLNELRNSEEPEDRIKLIKALYPPRFNRD
jgi:hypothetical protein